MKTYPACLMLCLSLFISSCDCWIDPALPPTAGWAVGHSTNTESGESSIRILHTADGGESWSSQTVPEGCDNWEGVDVSAIDSCVAWVAAGGEEGRGGILHTADGGETWTLQTLPGGMVSQHIKCVKGLSPSRAWAVSIRGDVVRTTDGGTNWRLVPMRTATGDIIPVSAINRMDAVGNDVWIVDVEGGAQGVIHSPNGGRTWWQEFLPDTRGSSMGPIVVSAWDSLTAWSAMNWDGSLWWTIDGGRSWKKSNDSLTGTADFDDICASSPGVVWIAMNGGGRNGGFMARVTVTDGRFDTNMAYQFPYMMEGVSPWNDDVAWAVGQRMVSLEPEMPMSTILRTDDGGVSWQSLTIPPDAVDVILWKISFAGARR